MNDALREPVRFIDERTASAPFLRQALRYVFPEHWSFLLGEVALYSFIILVGTGIYLALFFDPSLSRDHTVSCATCHNSDDGFTQRRPLPAAAR